MFIYFSKQKILNSDMIYEITGQLEDLLYMKIQKLVGILYNPNYRNSRFLDAFDRSVLIFSLW